LDRNEFEQLALEHLDSVYRMALKLTKNPDEASDLVQDTYVKALKACKGFQERGGGMRAWLFTILHHTFYSKVKRESKGPMSVEEFYEADHREAIPGDATPAWDLRSFDWEQVDERIKSAVESLSPEHQEVIMLWGVEGMKYREIANITAVPIGTVMSRLHRARRILCDSLEAFEGEFGSHT